MRKGLEKFVTPVETGVSGGFKTLIILDFGACPGLVPRFAGMNETFTYEINKFFFLVYEFLCALCVLCGE